MIWKRFSQNETETPPPAEFAAENSVSGAEHKPYMSAMNFWQTEEALIRMIAFAGVFLAMALLETLFPRKKRVKPRLTRWFASFGMLVIANLALRFGFPILAIGVAFWAEQQEFGLFNWLGLPIWLEVTLAVIALDFAIWAQHVITHYVPALWALHKVHHADEDLDASSGIRFHPLEQIFSMIVKIAIVALLGAAPLAVFLFEILLNATSMFNHASIHLPRWLDAGLRRVIVTPDFHRVHHSVHREETNSNFGFCLSVWDQLFKTCRAQPKDGHEGMMLGLDRRPEGNTTGLIWGLIAPFRRNDLNIFSESVSGFAPRKCDNTKSQSKL